MIQPKIILAKKLLESKNILYKIEGENDSECHIYLPIQGVATLENLVQIWNVLDDLDFRIFTGCVSEVKLLMKGGLPIVEFKARQRTYPSYSNPTTSSSIKNSQAPGLSFPKFFPTGKGFQKITESQALELHSNLLSEDFIYGEMGDIYDQIINNFYEVTEPTYVDDDFYDRIMYSISQPLPGDMREPKTPDSIKLIISKYLPKPGVKQDIIFILEQVERWKIVTKRSFYRCEGMTGLENAIDEIGLWKI